MPYLNLDPNYPDHPKTRRLMILLGNMADCLPIRLWAYCAKYHARDGRMDGYTKNEIEKAVLRWDGKPGEAIDALKKVGFVFETENGFGCNDWKEHEGHLEAFSRRGKVAAKARWNKYATSMHDVCLDDAPAVPSIPALPYQPIHPISTTLAELLKDKIVANNPKARLPAVLDKWIKEVDLMLKLDNRTEKEIEAMIVFSQADDFWKSNILSMGTLRKQFDKLWMKSQNRGGYGTNQRNSRDRIVGDAKPVPGKYDNIDGQGRVISR